MFDAPPPPDHFNEGLTIKYTPPAKQEEYNPFGGGEPIPDSLATTVDQVFANHEAELQNISQKDYTEVFSGKSLFDWKDRTLLKSLFDNFDQQRTVRLVRDSIGNFFMLFEFETEKGLLSYKINNIPSHLVEEYFQKEAEIISDKRETAAGFVIFGQKFPEYVYGISGSTNMFPKDPEDDYYFPMAFSLSIVEGR